MAPHSMVGHFTSYKILYFCSNFMKNYTFGFYIYNRKYNHCGLSEMWVIWWLLFSFSGSASCKEPSCRGRRHKRHGSDPWVRKIPWRREWQTAPVFLAGESHGQRSLEATVRRVAKGWTRLKQLSTRDIQLHSDVRVGFIITLNLFPQYCKTAASALTITSVFKVERRRRSHVYPIFPLHPESQRFPEISSLAHRYDKFPPTFHWPELCHTATSDCKGGWEN